MNEKQIEKPLSTADIAGVTDDEHNGREDHPIQDDRVKMGIDSGTAGEPRVKTEAKPMALLPDPIIQDFQSRWNVIQTGFVDEPRSAVENADALVAEIMRNLAEIFAKERSQLEEQWNRGDNASTEDLRITLQRYRSFFSRLLSM